MCAMRVWIRDDGMGKAEGLKAGNKEMLRVAEKKDGMIESRTTGGDLSGDGEGFALRLRGDEKDGDIGEFETAVNGRNGEPATEPLFAEEGALAPVEDEDGGLRLGTATGEQVEGGVHGRVGWGGGLGAFHEGGKEVGEGGRAGGETKFR